MKINVLYDDNKESHLNVTLELTDYQADVEKEIKKLKKTLVIPGFRPGKTPIEFVNKLYRKDVINNVCLEMSKIAILNYVKENKINLLSLPIELPPDDENKNYIDSDNNFSVNYLLAKKPNFVIDDSIFDDLIYYNLKLSEEEFKKESEYIRQLYGSFVEKEQVSHTSRVKLKLLITEEQTKIDDNEEELTFTLLMGIIDREESKKLYNSLIDKKINDKVEIEKDQLLELWNKKLLYLEDKFLKKLKETEQNETFLFEIILIEEFQIPELNQDFYKDFFKEKYDDKAEENFRNFVNNFALKDFYSLPVDFFITQVIKKILNKVEIEISENYLSKYYEIEKLQKSNEIKKYESLEDYIKSFKEYLIYNNLIEKLDIKVEDSEVEDILKSMLKRNYFRQFGYEPDDEELDDLYKKQYSKDKILRDKVVFNIEKLKIINKIKEKYNVKEEDITLQELLDKIKAINN